MFARLQEMFQVTPKPPSAAGDGTHYVFKPTLIGGARQFTLRPEGLSWQMPGKSGVWPLDKIAAIRLSYRPVSMQAARFRADIDNSDGQRVTLYSTTWHTVSLMARQDDGYRAFIAELHRRLQAAGSNAVLTTGLNRVLYGLGFVWLALIGLAMAGLLVRALTTGEFGGALFIVGFAALFAWQIGGFFRRNRPRRYTFDSLPVDVLP